MALPCRQSGPDQTQIGAGWQVNLPLSPPLKGLALICSYWSWAGQTPLMHESVH